LDNCSPDHTAAVVEGFDHPGIRYVRHPENVGARANFEACIEQAQGDYLLMLHDDDLIDSDFIETCIRALGDRTAAFVRTGTRVIDEEGTVLGTYPNQAKDASGREHVRSWFQKKVFWSYCSTLLHLDSLRAIGGIPSEFFLKSDVAIFAKLALRYEGVAVRAVKASQRKHETEISYQTCLSDWVEEGQAFLQLVEEEWGQPMPLHVHYEGRRFLSDIYYQFASEIDDPLQRMAAYLQVWMGFGIRYVPPGMLHLGRRVFRPRWANQIPSRNAESTGSLSS
jgi:glycosyltransferase involved in cell wall biosynthesis